jgi:hypothetical protein
MLASKNTNPMANQLGSLNALFNSASAQAHLPGHSSTSSTAIGSNPRPTINELGSHVNVGQGEIVWLSGRILFQNVTINDGFGSLWWFIFLVMLTDCPWTLLSEPLSLLGESEEYLEQESYLDEEQMITGEHGLPENMNANRLAIKRRKIFQAPRERQRGDR